MIMYLGQTTGSKSQNLQFLRFAAALAVIFSHSFVLSTGDSNREILSQLTRGELNFGGLAVSFFFFCGGYLIAGSLIRQKTAGRYFKARLLRLIPPLAFTTVCITVLGVFLTELSAAEYFSHPMTWKYLGNAIMVLQHDLPGVFTHNAYMPTVNGSLWTVPVEFGCYVACFLLYRMGLMEEKRFPISIPLVAAGSVAIWFAGSYISILREILRPALLFYIGVGYWVYRDKLRLDVRWMLIALIGIPILFMLRLGMAAMLVLFPYVLAVFCFGIRQCSSILGNLGNYSYTIYLWGFPVQQAVVQLSGGRMNPFLNALISIVIVIPLGILTWRIAEKGLQDLLKRK